MKKEYQKPGMYIVVLQNRTMLLAGSVTSTTNNVNMTYGGSGSGPARARSFDDWDDEE